jgi:hypothetical protein
LYCQWTATGIQKTGAYKKLPEEGSGDAPRPSAYVGKKGRSKRTPGLIRHPGVQHSSAAEITAQQRLKNMVHPSVLLSEFTYHGNW